MGDFLNAWRGPVANAANTGGRVGSASPLGLAALSTAASKEDMEATLRQVLLIDREPVDARAYVDRVVKDPGLTKVRRATALTNFVSACEAIRPEILAHRDTTDAQLVRWCADQDVHLEQAMILAHGHAQELIREN